MSYTLELIFKGRDQVSETMSGISGAFSKIGTIAGGIVASRVLWGIAEGFSDIATKAIQSVASIQLAQVALESLMAREYMKNMMEGATGATYDYAAALQAVKAPAAAMMDELAKLAILSPYSYESTIQTYKQAMAFGYASDEAKSFTQATLTMAAGIGADNNMLQRMGYNLSQIRMAGKVTALDIRQLAMAGLDLRDILKYVGDQMGVEIENHLDFNKAIAEGKITWQDFSRLYAQYADTYFGDASERLSRTLVGLKSTFADVFMLSMPKILGPAAEVITSFLSGILDKFLALRDSGMLEVWGENLRLFVVGVIDNITLLKEAFFGGTAELQTFSLEKVFNLSPEAAQLIIKIKDDIVALFDSIIGYGPQLSSIGESFGQFFNVIVSFVNSHYEEIKQVFIAIMSFITALNLVSGLSSIIGVIAGIGAVIAAINWPIVLLVGALTFLIGAWRGNWFGIRDTLTQVWTGTIQPALESLWTWLSINVPAAISAVSDFWNNTLMPAFQQGGGFIQTNVVPAFQALVSFFTGNVIPAFQALWSWISTYIFPLLQSIGNFIMAVFNVAWVNLSNLFTTIIIPALGMLWSYFSTYILPVLSLVIQNIVGFLVPAFQSVATFITGFVLPAIVSLASFIGTALTSALVGLTNMFNSNAATLNMLAGVFQLAWGYVRQLASAIQASLGRALAVLQILFEDAGKEIKFFQNVAMNVYGFIVNKFQKAFNDIAKAIQKVATVIDNVIDGLKALGTSIPDWLIPGSPTPFEIGLVGINKQMGKFAELTRSFPQLNQPGLQAASVPESGGAGMRSNGHVNFYFNDTTMGEAELRRALNRIG